MKKLRGVIFSEDNVLAKAGKPDMATLSEIQRLLRYLKHKGIQPVVLANSFYTFPDGKRVRDIWKEIVGDFPWYVTADDPSIPKKPTAGAVRWVLEKHRWDTTETIYVGNDVDDMRTAQNGEVLFVNATWFGDHTQYGFRFSTPREVARFIDTFCLRESLFGFTIEKPNFEMHALSTFSTYYEEFAAYSADARASAKENHPHRDFWLKYVVATLYFSEIYKRINFIASFPGHKVGAGNAVMADVLRIFAGSFHRKVKYLDDLIERHTQSIVSSRAGPS